MHEITHAVALNLDSFDNGSSLVIIGQPRKSSNIRVIMSTENMCRYVTMTIDKSAKNVETHMRMLHSTVIRVARLIIVQIIYLH